ncbi:MAG TPA: hypothetical protein VFW22_15105 [Pseudolabrys sp.]|nr:hypothetical protein [Pseudolabrys sp.]
MSDLIRIFSERGDLAHLALFLWATSASALAWFALRELTAASRRFEDFVREFARKFGGKRQERSHQVPPNLRGNREAG